MATTKAVITITLANGDVREHSYDVDTSESVLLAWALFYSTQIGEVLRNRTKHAFIVTEPVTVYNRDHIQSISIEFVDPKYYERIAESFIPDEMGFRTPTQDSER